MKSNTRSGKQNTDGNERIGFSSDDFMALMEKKFEELKQDVFKKIENEMNELKKNADFISSQYDELLKTLKNVLGLKKEIDQLKEENSLKDKKIKSIEMRLAEREQESIRDFIEITGADERPGEQPADAAVRVVGTLGLNLTPADIQRAFRSYDHRPGAPKKISIEVQDSTKRQALLALRTKAKIYNVENKNKIFIGEKMTPYLKELMWKAKVKAKSHNFSYVWFKNGKILIKKNEEAKVFSIKHEDDLFKLSNDKPADEIDS